MKSSLLVFCFVAATAVAQQAQVQTQAVSESNPAAASKAQPDAEKKANQQRARQLLEQAEAQARGLEPGMRALMLWQVAEAFAGIDRPRAVVLERDAFTATLSIDPSDADNKRFLQGHILASLLRLDLDAVEELVPQAEPAVRSEALGNLLDRLAQRKQFARAADLVNRVAAEPGPFPYGAVATLMVALPPDMAAERQNAFMQAFTAYQRSKDLDGHFSTDGFDRLIVRFGALLPRATVMDAIDEVLSRAKNSDQDARVTLSSSAGSAAFTTSYDYYLFELLPVIRRLDASKADDLLKQNSQLQGVMEKFPDGVRSLDPTIRDTPSKPGESGGMNISINTSGKKGSASPASNAGVGMDQLRAQYQAELEQIRHDAQKNPRQAIARAASLPKDVGGMTVRATAYEMIARNCWKQEPAAAKSALDELVKLVTDMTPRGRSQLLAGAADLYLQLDDKDDARKVVDSGIKAAEAIYDSDKDPDDPNTALKGFWPSTQAFEQFVMVAQRISPELAQQTIAGIKDDDVRTSVQVAYASALAGSGTGRTVITMTHKKNQNSTSIRYGN